MEQVARCLRPIDQILQAWAMPPSGELFYPRVKIGDLSVNGEYFLNHLSTGYPDLHGLIEQYESQYNALVDKVERIYAKVKAQLDELKGKEIIQWENGTVWAMQAFSNEIDAQIRRGVTVQKCQLEGGNIRLSAYIVVKVRDLDDAGLVVSTVNSLLDNQLLVGDLKDIWIEAQPLSQVLGRINRRMSVLKANGEAGADILGFCEGGVEAGYENRIGPQAEEGLGRSAAPVPPRECPKCKSKQVEFVTGETETAVHSDLGVIGVERRRSKPVAYFVCKHCGYTFKP